MYPITPASGVDNKSINEIEEFAEFHHSQKKRGFRYELREDRQREFVRSVAHLEGLKYQLLSFLSPHQQSALGFAEDRPHSSAEVQDTSRSPILPIPKAPRPPPRFPVDAGDISNLPGMKSLQAEILSLREEIRRIPGVTKAGIPTTEIQSAVNTKTTTLTNRIEGLQGLKNEIIDEVKGELHTFACQLMQFMSQQRLQEEISSEISSEAETIPGVRVANPITHPTLSRAPAIDRARIGGVSVKYAASDTSKMSLALPKRVHSKQQNR
ncbi:unnamed protein product [Rodentolepis nana]|uniref:Cauli_VI domain-containing protein n=1 Tax=Rodentolepis nana TaxID=102285 RepID=A0A0R3T1Q2_RODNA|nr:unnamed protein product [Rodentolepis nana]